MKRYKLKDKLKRALGDGFEGQMMFQPRARSPAAATAGPRVASEDVSAPPTNAGNKYAGRKHLHPANFVSSPESPTCGHHDHRRDGHRSKRAIVLEPDQEEVKTEV